MAMRTIQTDAVVRVDQPRKKRSSNDNLSPFDEIAWCHLCELTYTHTSLINAISQQIQQNPLLLDWINTRQDSLIQNGSLQRDKTETKPNDLLAKLVKEGYDSLANSPQFSGMSARCKTSAKSRVEEMFTSWLVAHCKLIRKLSGKRRWLAILENDAELATTSHFSPHEIEERAKQILAEINLQLEAVDQKDSRKVINALFHRLDETQAVLNRRAIIHLLRQGGKVRVRVKLPRNSKGQSQPLQPKTLSEQIEAKHVEIERLEQKLLGRLPRARHLLPDQAFEQYLEALIALPDSEAIVQSLSCCLFLSWLNITIATDNIQLQRYFLHIITIEPERVQADFWCWYESMTRKLHHFLREPKSLPYPIRFGYDDLQSWQVDENGKILFKLNGWGNLIFEVRCNRRQLGLIKTFLKDWQTAHDRGNKNQYSGSLMALRCIELIWEPEPECEDAIQACSQCEMLQSGAETGFWNHCKLTIHWTFDHDALTRPGSEAIRLRKLEPQLNALKTLQSTLEQKQSQRAQLEQEVPKTARSQAQLQQLETLSQQIHKLQTELEKPRPKLVHLQTSKLFDRPDRPLYVGVPNIFVGVLLDLNKHLVVAVVDAMRRKVLTYRTTRSISPAGYKLLQKYFRQRQHHAHQRQHDQAAHRHIYPTDSNLGQQVVCVLAQGLVALAQEYRASTIVLPITDGWRERLYSQLVARAKIVCKGNKQAMAQYTKQHGERLHQWDYRRLSQAIHDRAEVHGLAVILQPPVFEVDAFQQAASLAISAYDSLISQPS